MLDVALFVAGFVRVQAFRTTRRRFHDIKYEVDSKLIHSAQDLESADGDFACFIIRFRVGAAVPHTPRQAD